MRKFFDMQLVLATHNKHKRDELAAMLGSEFEIQILPDNFPEIEETGTTLTQNAMIKARSVFNVLHIPTLADDTGLEVAALGGAPGVFTARYAGENATYEENCKKLLYDLGQRSDRDAVFKTVLCFVNNDRSEEFFEGIVEGRIADIERGKNGFGYDPIFIPNEAKGRTFAEMTSAEKNAISHRARAVGKFARRIRNVK
ncbi:MAG TPA: RdgB/HAM1 family non-canonical purine NTP pyrophosphatase [Candidatus Kapabacteria bacterium]|nr:RdgB/HAM1 family non-canonical purine NTP pyrophosphatase [Candidatus Kapabacteria bacterium]